MNCESALNMSFVRPLIFKWELGFKFVYLLGASLIIALVGFYVFQVSAVTRASFSIAQAENQVADSDKEFKSLQLNFSDVSSLAGLEEALVARGYEKVGRIHYIQMMESTVAVKK